LNNKNTDYPKWYWGYDINIWHICAYKKADYYK